jgi:hypothetical protein
MDLKSAVSAILSPLFLAIILNGLKTHKILNILKVLIAFKFFPLFYSSPKRDEITIKKSRTFQPYNK